MGIGILEKTLNKTKNNTFILLNQNNECDAIMCNVVANIY